MTKAALIERHARLLDALKLIDRGNKPYRDGEQWAVTAKLELGRIIAETLVAACEASDDIAGPNAPTLADALTAKVENRALIADALTRADGFMSGFEDDEGQEGVNDALAVIRRALALVA